MSPSVARNCQLITPRAQRWLQECRQARVLHLFDTACNLVDEHGRVLSLVPLRNRRRTPDGEQLFTRIGEGLTEWTLDDGTVGYGLSEYLDQIVDGTPTGRAE